MSEKAPKMSREQYLAAQPNVSGDELIEDVDTAQDMANAFDPHWNDARAAGDKYYEMRDTMEARGKLGVAALEKVFLEPLADKAVGHVNRGRQEMEVARLTHEDPEAAAQLQAQLDAEDAEKQKAINDASRMHAISAAHDTWKNSNAA